MSEVDEGEASFATRSEELFNRLANEDAVSSESAGLVVALAFLDLAVTEEEVVEATRQILQPMENQFSKDEFLRFTELLRDSKQPSVEGSANREPLGPTQMWGTAAESAADAAPGVSATVPWPEHPGLVGGESPEAAKSGAEASRVEDGVSALWVFEPQISTDLLDVDALLFAKQVYAKVEQEMVSEINEAVDTDFQTFLSTLPGALTENVQQALRQGWLVKHYVKLVAAVVERCTKAKWSFTPAVALDELSAEERPKAAKLYSSVDEAAANKIDEMVESDFMVFESTLPASVSSTLKESLRMGWLKGNYVKIVARVLEEASRGVAAKWAFLRR